MALCENFLSICQVTTLVPISSHDFRYSVMSIFYKVTWADRFFLGGGGWGRTKNQELILVLSHFVSNLLSSVLWLNSDCIACRSVCF